MLINTKQKVFLWLGALLVAFWLALFSIHSTSGFYNNLFGFVYTVISLLAGAIALKNTSQWPLQEMIRKGLFWGGLGLICWGVGGLVWLYYSFFKDIILPYPSVADFFYLPSVFLYSLGVIYFARASGTDLKVKSMSEKIFIISSTIIISIVSYYVLVVIVRDGKLFDPESSILKNLLNIAYPCMDFVGLTIAVLVFGFSFKSIVPMYKIALAALSCGLVLMFVSDSLLTYMIIHGTYYNAGYSDLSFSIAISTLVFGIMGFCGQSGNKTEHNIHVFDFLRY